MKLPTASLIPFGGIVLWTLLFVSCSKKITEPIVANPPVMVPETTEVNPSPPAEVGTPVEGATLVASIRRSPCYGNCPSYEAKIFRNGRAIYEGKQNVAKIGLFEAQISSDQLARLADLIAAADYASFSARYPADRKQRITDLPTVHTSARAGERVYEVSNNHSAPAALRDFETSLDALLDELHWIRIDG